MGQDTPRELFPGHQKGERIFQTSQTSRLHGNRLKMLPNIVRSFSIFLSAYFCIISCAPSWIDDDSTNERTSAKRASSKGNKRFAFESWSSFNWKLTHNSPPTGKRDGKETWERKQEFSWRRDFFSLNRNLRNASATQIYSRHIKFKS